jgi:outer membrane protein
MIKSALSVLLAFICTAVAEDERLKIGTVDMQRLFREYHRTQAAQKESNVELARLQKQDQERLAGIREIESALEKFRKQLEDPAVAESKKDGLRKQAYDRHQEGVALERERHEFVARRRQSINERMMQEMMRLLAEIRKELEEIARTEDYDYVFDASGLSSWQVPFVLSSARAGDLTEVLLTKLNAGAAKGEAQPPPK